MLIVDQQLRDRAHESARRALGDDEFAHELDRGRALPHPEVIALATTMASSDDVRDEQPPPTPRVAAVPGIMPVLQVSALGPLEIRVRGELLAGDALRLARPRDLLLYLLSNERGRTREQLGLVFWPDLSPAQVKNNFHVALHTLRKSLGLPEVVVFDDDRYRINWSLGVEFDAERFERELPAALRQAVSPEETAPLEAALALFRGDFLEELTVGDWHLAPRDRLRRLWADGMFRLGELHMDAGHHVEAAEVLRRLVQREELHEEAHRRLMVALSRAGQRQEALRSYDRLATLLRTDLDAEPEPETVALHRRIRSAESV
jgi:DNA-binding SARP family transcriptional activator